MCEPVDERSRDGELAALRHLVAYPCVPERATEGSPPTIFTQAAAQPRGKAKKRSEDDTGPITIDGAMPQKRFYRARAHVNPLSHNDSFE